MKCTQLYDFHSHFPAPNAIYCTAFPSAYGTPEDNRPIHQFSEEDVLMHFEGLLPQYWTPQRNGALERILESAPAGRPIHLGEVGIDRRFESTMPLETQYRNLVSLLRYARSLGRKVTIHSVRATEPTLKALAEVKFPQYSVLWHGFTGSKETAAQLRRLGISIGIGPRFHGDLRSVVEANPSWAIETDYEGTDENQYNGIISELYRSVADRLGLDEEKVEEHCCGQAKAFADK